MTFKMYLTAIGKIVLKRTEERDDCLAHQIKELAELQKC